MEATALQTTIPLKVAVSLRFRYHRPFERGMNEGAQAAALDILDSGKDMGFRCGYTAARENAAFAQGFELGKGYIEEWRASKDLLRLAVRNGDVVPKDFKSAICQSSLNHYWDEK